MSGSASTYISVYTIVVHTILHPSIFCFCFLCVTQNYSVSMYNRKQHGIHSFSSSGPQVWYELPYSVRHCTTLSSLKSNTKTYIFLYFWHLKC